MAYSDAGIINLALLDIGADTITTLTDVDSPNALKANAIFEYILDEVLQARDWSFAKTRVELSKSATAPLYGYACAYSLPADFLRLVRPNKDRATKNPPVYPEWIDFVIEALPSGILSLFTDYDNETVSGLATDTTLSLYINYIRKITDRTKFTPTFIKALSKKLGASLAISISESKGKRDAMLAEYYQALNEAEGVNASSDYLQDETGNTDWIDAGR